MNTITVCYVLVCLILGEAAPPTAGPHQEALTPTEGGRGGTVALVVDTTRSMVHELEHIKEGVRGVITTVVRLQANRTIYNYALVPFNDPGVGPVLVTTNPADLLEGLQSLTPEGGADCPEGGLSGVHLAVEHSLPSSLVFVFSDAAAKGYHGYPQLLSLVQRKQTRVVFLLTGTCSGRHSPGYRLYEDVALASGGDIFVVGGRDLPKVFPYMTHVMATHGGSQLVSSWKGPGGGGSSVPLSVEPSLTSLTVSLSGEGPRLSLTAPDGVEAASRRVLWTDAALVLAVAAPRPGNWTLYTHSSSPAYVHVTAACPWTLSYAFLHGGPHEGGPTATALAGRQTTLLVSVSQQPHLQPPRLLQVCERDLRGRRRQVMQLRPTPGGPGGAPILYQVDVFDTPEDPFYLEVRGVTHDGYVMQRLTPTALVPLQPRPPTVTVPLAAPGSRLQPYTLRCHIDSPLPFWAAWLKGGHTVMHRRVFRQPAEVLLHIPSLTPEAAGLYTCQAGNVAGTATQHLLLGVSRGGPDPEGGAL